jgi:hypothetical protein
MLVGLAMDKTGWYLDLPAFVCTIYFPYFAFNGMPAGTGVWVCGCMGVCVGMCVWAAPNFKKGIFRGLQR